MYDGLLAVLAATLTADPSVRRPAEQQLKQWETIPGFHESLLSILESVQTPLPVRIQAVLVFKNAIDRWRKSNSNAIDPTSKARMRGQLLSLLDQDNSTISKTLAVCLGKIARLDYDADWPSLPNELLHIMATCLNSNNDRRMFQTLLATKQIVKALIANRMPRGRKLVRQLAPILFSPLCSLYTQFYTSIITSLGAAGAGTSAGDQQLVTQLDILLLLIKILRDLVAHGWLAPENEQEPSSFVAASVHHVSQLYTLKTSSTTLPPAVSEKLTKVLTNYGKLYLEEYKRDADTTKSLFEFYWLAISQVATDHVDHISQDVSGLYPEPVMVQAITIIRRILATWPSTDDATKLPMSDSEHVFHAQLSSWCQDASILLVTKLVPMREQDVELWNDDPEAGLNEEEADREELDLRPAAIGLLSDLLSQFKTVVAQNLVGLLASPEMKNPQNDQALLVKEALYSALGKNPTNVLEALATFKPFERWLAEDLLVELVNPDPRYAFVRRRIIWLLGSWVGEEISIASKTEIYRHLVQFVQPGPLGPQWPPQDIATRLTAARALGKCDSWGFEEESLKPFLKEAIQALMQLVDEVQTVESRTRLMITLGTLTDRMGGSIAPFAEHILNMLPRLWQEADDQPLFKVNILAVVSKLTEAIGVQSQHIQPQLCSLISYSMDPTRSEYVYLHEEAIEMWRLMLRYATAFSEPIASLLPVLVNLLQDNMDTLTPGLKILESYCLLDASFVLRHYATPICVAFENLLDVSKPLSVTKSILHAFNVMISSAPAELWQGAVDGSNCMVKLAQSIHLCEDNLTLCKYLETLSRIAVVNVDAFFALVYATAPKLGVAPSELLHGIVTAWVDIHDNIGGPKQRKMSSLALSLLITRRDETVLLLIPHFVPIWLSGLAETEESADGDALVYSLMDAYDSEGEFEAVESPEADRRTALRDADPVHSVKLSTTIQANLEVARQLWGQELDGQLAKLDPLLLDELQRRLQGSLKG